ncbi:MAG TPA: hypothetical protein PK560_12190, partial [bacterium]|nr:hypothetical protein [bacterium]
VFNQGGQGVGGNPVVILVIDEANLAVGELSTSLFSDAKSIIYLVDVDWAASKPGISCFHAFGEGSVNVSTAGDVSNHGGLAFTGSVTWYNPKNYANGAGDISSQLSGVTVCAAK